MQRPLIILLSAILALGTLAGCLGAEPVPTGTPDTKAPDSSGDATVTATTGAIRGAASSLSYEPLAGARVTLLDADRQTNGRETIVARDGTFAFGEVEPGSYFVHISALGYNSAQRPVVVTAGEVTQVTFQLDELRVEGPWVDEREWVGIIRLGVRWQIEPAGIGCQVFEVPVVGAVKTCGGYRLLGQSGDNGEVAVGSADTAKTIMAALVWTPAGPLGENLMFDFMCVDTPRSSSGAVLDTEHPCYFEPEKTTSPIVHRIDEAHWLEHGYNFTANWAARIFATYGMLGTYPLTGIDAGVAYEQSFKIYSAVFHEQPAPEGFSPVPEA
jgi:hypothetical protein